MLFGSVALPTEQVAAQGESAPPSNNASLNVPGIAELGYNPRYVTPATPAGYGQTIASYASGSLPTPWKYQGRLDVSPDSANPLYEAGARYYSPAIGAFTQLDSYAGSAQNPLSLNRYLYAGANPTSFVDPDGHRFMATAGVDPEPTQPLAKAVVMDQFRQAGAREIERKRRAAAASRLRGLDVGAVVGNVAKVGVGVVGRQVGNLLSVPGGLVHLAVSAPGAAFATPGVIADVVRDPGRAWNIGSTAVINGGTRWIIDTSADLTSGNLDRIANGISSSIDIAFAVTGVSAGAKAAAGRLSGAAEAGSAILRPSSLAAEVANATGGAVRGTKGGYVITIPNGSRGITVRVMEEGGGRSNYYRVSVPGKETYTATGQVSTDPALTHIDIASNSLDDILSIIDRIQGGR